MSLQRAELDPWEEGQGRQITAPRKQNLPSHAVILKLDNHLVMQGLACPGKSGAEPGD